MTDELNEGTAMEQDLETTDDADTLADATTETSEEKKTRKPRTTSYYGLSHDGKVLTFSGTKEDAKVWASDELPQHGLHEIAFFRQRSHWCLLVTGAGAGEHVIDGDVEGVPAAVLDAFEATGGKSVPAGRKTRSKFKFDAQTKLERHVLKWAKEQEDAVVALNKVLADGCSSNVVEHLVTPEQTAKFYRKYRLEISMLITDAIRAGLISNAAELEGWDASDPLAQKAENQNVLAWFGFEMGAKNLSDRAGVPAAE